MGTQRLPVDLGTRVPDSSCPAYQHTAFLPRRSTEVRSSEKGDKRSTELRQGGGKLSPESSDDATPRVGLVLDAERVTSTWPASHRRALRYHRDGFPE
jgi:hypothetical protein